MGEYNPIEKDYILQYNKEINESTLDSFVSLISGTHNFRSFTSDKDKDSYERDVTIDYKIENNILILRFYSTGFLRYMIRNIVGLLLEINDGKKTTDDIKYIFDSKSRCSLGVPAQGCALYLNKVIY
jgi:tRNA pseudouridine38-40 synthase